MTCAVEIAWSVSNEDKFENSGRSAGSRKTRRPGSTITARIIQALVDIEDNFYAIPDLDLGGYYRVKLEGRREGNDKWTCVHKSMIRSVGHSVRLGNGGICVDF